MQRPLFREICARVYGKEAPIAAFRAMFMNKPARKGTLLPWHQDTRRKLRAAPSAFVTWTRAQAGNGETYSTIFGEGALAASALTF